MDNDSSLKFYLTQLNDATLLTRDEEEELLQNIEVRQNQILQECVRFKFFREELLDLLKSQKTEDIVKISRKLDDTSPKSKVNAVLRDFRGLIKNLENGAELEIVQASMDKISLSGTLVHTLVTRIKKKYSKIETYESDLEKLLQYFEVQSASALDTVIEKIKNSDVAKNYFARKFYTNEQRLMSKVYEYTELVASMQALEDSGIERSNFPEMKTLYRKIMSTEKEMKVFKDELVRRNLRLVVSRAKKFTNRGLDFEDLVQEGNIGLIKAINKHDASRGTKIGTYATWWIDQTIRRAISNKAKTVRIPTHIEFLQTQLATIVTKLTNELGRPPSKEEIAEKADVDVEVLKKLDRIALHEVGIEDETSSGLSLLDVLQSDQSESPFNLTAKRLLRERIRKILGTLPPRTEKIIRLRFGIGEPQEEMTLQQIADQVGLTKMGVRLVQNKGLARIKKKGDFQDDLS